MTRIAIIGAGIAGLACARRLTSAGFVPVVFDKGRGIGGRVATRRAGEFRFDHGAPYVSLHTSESSDPPDFIALMRELTQAGHCSAWFDQTETTRIVGTPGMSSIPKAMAAELDVRLETTVTSIEQVTSGWHIHFGDTFYAASHVILCVPAPQIAALLGEAHPFNIQIEPAQMSPGLTLMAAVEGESSELPPDRLQGSLDLILAESSKPGRSQKGSRAWVAHAGPSFTSEHLEKNKPEIAALMVPLLCEQLGVSEERVIHAAAHRWRYSRVAKPLGQPFVRNPEASLYLGGDWCVGPNIQDAWTSGTAIADSLIGELNGYADA